MAEDDNWVLTHEEVKNLKKKYEKTFCPGPEDPACYSKIHGFGMYDFEQGKYVSALFQPYTNPKVNKDFKCSKTTPNVNSHIIEESSGFITWEEL